MRQSRFFDRSNRQSSLRAGNGNGNGLAIERLEERITPTFGFPTLASEIPAGGATGNNASQIDFGALSANGRYLAFSSLASNLVTGISDNLGFVDVFRRDLQTGITQLVSVSQSGSTVGNAESLQPAISADGRYVAFASTATNLATSANNGFRQIFVRDLLTNTTTCVSVTGGGVQGNRDSNTPLLSASGRRVLYQSNSTNLATGDANNAVDLFVRDLDANSTILVSIKPGGGTGNAASGLGRYAISSDGNSVAFASRANDLLSSVSDTNNANDVFVRRLNLATTIAVSVSSNGFSSGNGASDNPSISDDGNRVAFASSANDFGINDTNNTSDVYVREISTSSISAASIRADGAATAAAGANEGFITADGLRVFFKSNSTDISGSNIGFSQLYCRNLTTQLTNLVSVNSLGNNGGNASAEIPFYTSSANSTGTLVAFASMATDLVVGDNNGVADVFVRDVDSATTFTISRSSSAQSDGDSLYAVISSNGSAVAFQSGATNLTTSLDSNNVDDLFVAAIANVAPPAVANIWFDGSAWSSTFRAAAGNPTYGYPAQTGVGQLANLPWSNLNRIRIQFTKNVAVDAGDLAVRGLNVANYPLNNFAYDSSLFVATWTIGPIGTDRFILDLDADSATAVQDASGNKLAGTWTESASTFPTTGVAGVDFRYRFNVLVGDANRSGGVVSNADLNAVRAHLFFDVNTVGYDIYRDIDGSGTVLNVDLNAVRAALFTDLPGGNPNRPGSRPKTNSPSPVSGQSKNFKFEISDFTWLSEFGRSIHRRPALSPQIEQLDQYFASE